MNTNFEKTPFFMFDWLEDRSFKELDASQQKQVLEYFSQEEYNEMHVAAKQIQMVTVDRFISNATSRKDDLLKRFDQHHNKNIRSIFTSNVWVWQAASAVFLLLSGFLFYLMMDLKKDTSSLRLASSDTVFVNREIKSAPEIIHDTVYLYKQKLKKNKASSYENPPVVESFMSTDDFYVVPLKEVDNDEPRGNSMKDDSLPKRYGAVSL